MTGPVFTSRLSGRQLLDSEGFAIGRVRDIVILPSASGEAPWVLGLIVTLQRRQIFVNLGRVAEVSIDGIRLRGGTIDLRRFSRRTGELLASELYGKPVGPAQASTSPASTGHVGTGHVGTAHVGPGRVMDIGIAPSERRRGGWDVVAVAVGHGLSFLHNSVTVVPWDKYPELFKPSALGEQLISLREMHPTDLASAVEVMSATRRRELAEALQNEELADLLEEMPEQDQIRLLAGLGLERSADVVEEMEPDDAADLLAEMSDDQRERLLAAMEAVPADRLRRLLRYDATTAGGLMTTNPLIVPPDAPVAQVLAEIRPPEVAATVAAQVYVCEPPSLTPTGRYLGTVGFQRLLREPPATTVGQCIEDTGFVRPDLPEKEVARRMAAYNLIGVAVCDEAGCLLGAITVDDVLDRILPTGWRKGEAL